MKHTIFTPPLTFANNTQTSLHWSGLRGGSRSLLIAETAKKAKQPVLVIAENEQRAYWLEQELNFYTAGRDVPLLHFPDWETLPYDVFSPHQDIISSRLRALQQLPTLTSGIVIITVDTLLPKLAPRQYIDGSSFILKTGDILDINAFRNKISNAGYQSVSTVNEHGEYAMRGSILDVFPMGSNTPLRIDMFDDEIDSIRLFDVETQLSGEKIQSVDILPAREFPFNDDAVSQFRRNYRDVFTGNPQDSQIYRDISENRVPGGIEYYLPLFFDHTTTLLDYFDNQPLVIHDVSLYDQIDHAIASIHKRYEQRKSDVERPILAPDIAFSTSEAIQQQLNQLPCISLNNNSALNEGDVDFATKLLPPLSGDAQAESPFNKLFDYIQTIQQADGRVLFVAESTGHREQLLELLRANHVNFKQFATWAEFRAAGDTYGVTVANIEHGVELNNPKLAIIPDGLLYGAKPKAKQRRKAARDPATIIADLGDLVIGSPVVHEEQGIGRYIGLQKLALSGFESEFLTIEYAGGDKLYVPVHNLELVSRFTGTDPEHAPLHRLGGGNWGKTRRTAAKKIRDVAAELLEIQARRAAKGGIAMKLDEAEYRHFSSGFPFEETEDQAAAIGHVLTDLTTTKTMDRIVCGDVGFGKTEVAMRAAYVAISNNKQVAILVPTTLLAQQHFQNFQDRFADWPVKVESLSRFRTPKEQQRVLDGMADGTVDIVIGTHKLLQPSIKFDRLGLVIVDEEHRFGVRHKESLKKLRAEIDLLTLTATPIPRTLNMSLAGLRDMSIIATPPANRLAVKTFVSEWNDATIVEAIQRELRRGGQAYFVHNKVENIQQIITQLEDLMPDVSFQFAHGQMRERELEQVMLDFYHRRFHVLVATTIIESGIDIPNANTIIINRADRFGLAQLHQMRGRVGRSHHRAYAYLIKPPNGVMTPDAKKRLDAIGSLEDLGSGFTLATHDLEIRGAGELLGDGQSGHMQEIGFALYNELLEKTVKALKNGEEVDLEIPEKSGPEVDLGIPALIPEDYLPDVHLRLMLYKRITAAEDKRALDEIQIEMIDRFGLLPDESNTLFHIAALKQRANRLGITQILAGPSGGKFAFTKKPKIDPMNLLKLIQGQPDRFKFDGHTVLTFQRQMEEPNTRAQIIDSIINQLVK